MPTSSQGPSGSGLATSLVNDFRAIMSSLETQRAGTPASEGPDAPAASDAEAPRSTAPAADLPAEQDRTKTFASRFARPAGLPRQPLPDRPAPLPYAEVRGRITALGDVRDMLSSRRLPAALSETEESAALAAAAGAAVETPAESTSPRRRAFGAACKTEETAARRRRAASKDVITWQRLGLLAVFIGIAGGGAMALQSVVGRDEATVAPDVIGNAAIASVAPSAPVPFVAAPVPPESVPPAQVATLDSAPMRPTLRAAEPELDEPDPDAMESITAATASAFAASAAIASPIIAPKPLPIPKPPVPAAAPKPVAAATAPAPAAEKEEADPDEPDGTTAFGGEPTGSAIIRSSVTMRAAPKKGATPVANLQGGQKVELVACKGWCEIIVEGKRGFIYKSFVTPGAPKQADAAAQ